jgi:uncharacterized membrane protein required for colicin V production
MDTVGIVNLTLFGVLFIGTFVGFAKGFLEQAVELVGAVGAFVLAILLAGGVARFAERHFDIAYSAALVISFILLVVAGLVATHFAALAIGRVVKMTILRMVDRFTGAVLGLITAMLVASLMITVTLEMPLSRSLRNDVAGASMSLFLRPMAGQMFNWVIDRTSGSIHFEDIFKRSNTV